MAATLADIMKKLSVTDALSLKNSFPLSKELSDCLQQRVDPVSYFQQTFKYPITLMAAMFDCGAVLSGSRALEYFFPGSLCPGSDWDFYVPAYKESVADMVNALQICGVNWSTDASNIASDLFKNNNATISRMMLESLLSWVTNLGEKSACHILGKELYDITYAYSKQKKSDFSVSMFEMKLDAEKNIQFIPLRMSPCQDEEIPYHDVLGRSSNILHGTIITSKGCETVQLIICSTDAKMKSCMSFIGDLYASNVQCFIGGWCAGHLYYNQTSMKKAAVWRYSSEKLDSLILRAMRQFKTTGFEYTDERGSGLTKIRALTDDDAHLSVYGNMYRKYIPEYCHSILNDWNDQRQDNIETITWIENDGCVLGVSSPQERFYGSSNITFASSGKEMPMCARRRLGNIIATNAKCPDELRSGSYRSAVGKNVMEEGWEMQTVARSGTASYFFKDATPRSWVL